MKDIKIYTAGKNSGLTKEEAMSWRRQLEKSVRQLMATMDLDKRIRVTFVHPSNYYFPGENNALSDKEVLYWMYKQIHESDIVVVSLEGVLTSVGTLLELGAIQAINTFADGFISVVGIGDKTGYDCVDGIILRRENTVSKAAEYIIDYLLL